MVSKHSLRAQVLQVTKITLIKTQMLDTNGHTKQEMRQMPVQEDHVFYTGTTT